MGLNFKKRRKYDEKGKQTVGDCDTGSFVGGVLLHGADRLVPPLHAGRRERGALQPARVPALLPCGTEITKENSETRSPA